MRRQGAHTQSPRRHALWSVTLRDAELPRASDMRIMMSLAIAISIAVAIAEYSSAVKSDLVSAAPAGAGVVRARGG